MVWEKIKDTESYQYNARDQSSRMFRIVTFQNKRFDSSFGEFTIRDNKTGEFHLTADAKNKESYQTLKRNFITASLPMPDASDEFFKIFRLVTHDSKQIINFVNLIDSLDPDFGKIKKEICDLLGIKNDTWIRIGNFNITQNSNTENPVTREATFKNHDIHMPIFMLKILGYQDGSVQLIAEILGKKVHPELIKAILEAGLSSPESDLLNIGCCRLVTTDLCQVKQFMRVLIGIDAQLAHIEQEICESVGIALAASKESNDISASQAHECFDENVNVNVKHDSQPLILSHSLSTSTSKSNPKKRPYENDADGEREENKRHKKASNSFCSLL